MPYAGARAGRIGAENFSTWDVPNRHFIRLIGNMPPKVSRAELRNETAARPVVGHPRHAHGPACARSAEVRRRHAADLRGRDRARTALDDAGLAVHPLL